MELSKLTLQELNQLLLEIPQEIKRREKTEKRRIRKELEEIAARAGFTLEQLLDEASTKASPATRRPAAIKYRHPQKPDLVWTGRGRSPRWFQEYIDQGGKTEDLLAK